MKPLRLEFNGINSFSEPAEIDFSGLLEYGLFGIFGDTGSGKSTILDCITFALYGTVARTPRGGAGEIINHRLDRAYVNFEFGIEEQGKRKHYRVERTVRRKNAVQTLKVIDCGENLVLSEGVREGGALLERIIGLSEEDFERCIALPQGEFAQFIKSQRADRLKLVTRLFDLEEYGEKLFKRASGNYARLAGELDLLRARLEPFETVTAEGQGALKEEIARLAEEEKKQREALSAARAEEKTLTERRRSQLEREKVVARLVALGAQEGEISLLERDLGKAEQAAAAVSAEKERLSALSELESARTESGAALQAKERGEAALAALPADDEALDVEIDALTARLAVAEQQEDILRRARELRERLERTRKEYAAEKAQFADFSYDRDRAALEEKLSALGEEDFYTFAERHAASLFRSEYAAFARELAQIQAKYPETERDISVLIAKYISLSEGEREDLLRLKEEYEEKEEKRRAVQASLLALEKRNGNYHAHCERLKHLQEEGMRVREELDGIALPDAPLSRSELERALAAGKREKRDRFERREKTRQSYSAALSALAAASERERAAADNLAKAKQRLGDALGRGGFSSAEEAAALCQRLGSGDAAARVKAFREEWTALTARKRELPEEEEEGLGEKLSACSAGVRTIEAELEETVRLVALKKEELRRGEEALEKKSALEGEEKRLAEKTQTAERLKKLLEGNKFMEYVAEEYLQDITKRASARLLSLTSGQYFLRYDKGFFVGDNLSGGALRAVYTLSGGETFLVSLSLALSLSTEICIKAARPIEFFFLDEGFGTLDSNLVDTVMDSLEKLKGANFSIGIISHVEELKHRIIKKLYVEKATDSHGSRIRG